MTHKNTNLPEAEKLAKIYEGGCAIDKRVATELRRLHARVQELEEFQAQRVPLSDLKVSYEAHEECAADWNDLRNRELWMNGFEVGFRSAERAHGITQDKP